MSTFSTGVGLVSGLPTRAIIDQLMAIEARPRTLLSARISSIQAERTALLDVAARLLAIKNAIAALKSTAVLRAASAASSNPNVLTATAGEAAAVGSFTFRVRSLVSNHQLVSRGFADATQTAVGAGTLTVELGNGRLNRDTPLDFLNGQQGVRRGTIRVTDRSGAFADIDLTTAQTVADVLEAINSATGVSVSASVESDHLVLTDQSGGAGNLTVSDLGGGYAAADLGIQAGAAGDRIVGGQINYLIEDTLLRLLNDGNGVRRRNEGALPDSSISLRDASLGPIEVNLGDDLQDSTPLALLNHGRGVNPGTIRITDRSGASAQIDLAGATTVGEVVQRINDANVGASAVISRSRITVTDTTNQTAGNLIVEDVSGTAAADLRIAASVSASSIQGGIIYQVSTIGDVIRAINLAPGNNGYVVASLDRASNSLVLTDTTTGTGNTTVTASGAGLHAADDLGLLATSSTGAIQGRRLLAGLNSTLLRSLNGGRGVQLGTLSVVNRQGVQTQIDLTGAQTVQEVIDRLNQSSPASGISAALNAPGSGILLSDTTSGTGNLEVLDSPTAQDLHLVGSYASGRADSGNLQLRYVSEATRLADLNYGRGVARGAFRITTGAGSSAVIDLRTGTKETVADLLREINGHPNLTGIVAQINERGDGIIIRDTAGGAGRLTISEEGSTTARDLNLLGQAAAGGDFIDGSYEIRIDVGASDTLTDLQTKINAATTAVRAAVINDGSASNPYRLSIASLIGGRRGEIVLDTGGIDLSPATLSRARDAVVQLGGGMGETPIVVVSPSNTITGVVPGLTLNLLSSSVDSVTVTVTQDLDGVVSAVQSLVTAYNDAIERMAELTAFDQETQTRGVLLGDATVSRVRARLSGAVLRSVPGVDPGLSRLSSLGIRLSGGGKLNLDEQKLRDLLASDPQAVEAFFAGGQDAFATHLDRVLDELTNSSGGLIARQSDVLQNRVDLLNDRVEALNKLLEKRRQRLTQEFQSLETALSQLQAQQQALLGLTLLLPGGGGGLPVF